MAKRFSTTFAQVNPEIAKEWIYEKNGELTPDMVAPKSNKKVWWRCSVCSFEWLATPNQRTSGYGCRKCGKRRAVKTLITNKIKKEGSFGERFPELLKEWDYEKNQEITPYNILPQTRLRSWWRCSTCGHSWSAIVASRSKYGYGCPKCGIKENARNRKANILKQEGPLIKTHPEIAKDWDYEKNGELTPNVVTFHSTKVVNWVCHKGHEYKRAINNRISLKIGCPICAQEWHTSFPEQAIFFYLNKIVPCLNRWLIEKTEIDIFIPNLNIGIEYDGILYHSSPKSIAREKKKNLAMRQAGIRLIRVKESKESKISGDVIFTKATKDYTNLAEVVKILCTMIGLPDTIEVNIDRDRSIILEQFIINEKANSLAVQHPELLKQWDYEKNGRLKPEFIRSGSNHKYWWRCNNGHSWQATAYSRINGNGCPCCSGKVLVIGQNDLLSQNPTLAVEWNHERNGELTPDQTTIHNGKKVWWKCVICGHEWQATPAHRSNGRGCPVCGRKKRDAARTDAFLKKHGSFVDEKPELLEEWDYEKNKGLDPYRLTPANGTRAWWICKKCGHSWSALISNRVRRNSGCPECARLSRLKYNILKKKLSQ